MTPTTEAFYHQHWESSYCMGIMGIYYVISEMTEQLYNCHSIDGESRTSYSPIIITCMLESVKINLVAVQ